jgi:hypothetical protein
VATIYIDTSALVKRYVAEVGSAWVRRMVARPVQHVIYTVALTEVEVRSALQRNLQEINSCHGLVSLVRRIRGVICLRCPLCMISSRTLAIAGSSRHGVPSFYYSFTRAACDLADGYTEALLWRSRLRARIDRNDYFSDGAMLEKRQRDGRTAGGRSRLR